MIRILEINDKPDNAISFYRSRMPFNAIQKESSEITVQVFRSKGIEFTWETFSSYDILFFSNPLIQDHVGILKTAKNFGVKVWIDYDDCYFDIPKGCTAYSLLMSGHVTKTVKDCLSVADIITVSTNYLKEQYLPFNPNIKVLPNAFPAEYLTDHILGVPEQGKHNFVCFRGSDSHRDSLELFKSEIAEVANKNKDWAFKFFGTNPWYFDGMFKYNEYGFERCFDSFYKLKQFNSKIHIVPLNDRPFTRSKSNIAWVEATIAGSVVLAPNWEEWQKPGIITYNDKNDFKTKLDDMINGKYDFTPLFEASRDYILNNLSLKKINKDRLKIISELCVRKSDDRS